MREKFKTQLRVLWALMRREMTTRYDRSAGGYLWAIIEPIVFIVALTAIFSQIARVPPVGTDFALFFATGFIGFMFWRNTADVASSAVRANKALLTYPNVTPLDTVLARAALQILTNVVVSALILTVLIANTYTSTQLDVSALFVAVTLASLLAIGMGLLNVTLFPLFPTWERIFGLINRPILLISGVFFVPEDLPSNVRDAALYNPILHLVGIFRSAFYPTYEAQYVNYVYLIALIMGTCWIGLLLLQRYRYEVAEL